LTTFIKQIASTEITVRPSVMIPDIEEASSNVLVEIPEKEVMLQESRQVSHAARILKNDIEIKSNYYCMSG
jgi:hypothetical protein